MPTRPHRARTPLLVAPFIYPTTKCDSTPTPLGIATSLHKVMHTVATSLGEVTHAEVTHTVATSSDAGRTDGCFDSAATPRDNVYVQAPFAQSSCSSPPDGNTRDRTHVGWTPLMHFSNVTSYGIKHRAYLVHRSEPLDAVAETHLEATGFVPLAGTHARRWPRRALARVGCIAYKTTPRPHSSPCGSLHLPNHQV